MMEKNNGFSNKLYQEVHTTKSLTQKIKTIAYWNFACITLFKKLQENKLVLEFWSRMEFLIIILILKMRHLELYSADLDNE